VLTWTSQIVNGRYNAFIGYWHLAGTFSPSGSAPPPPPPTSAPHRTTTTVPKPTTTTTHKPTTTTTRPYKPTTTTSRPHKPTTTTTTAADLRHNVDLVNCAASPGGGWSAGGTVNNPTGQAVTYHITVDFTSGGRTLATSTASVPLAAGAGNLWSTTAVFAAPSSTQCVLKDVSTG